MSIWRTSRFYILLIFTVALLCTHILVVHFLPQHDLPWSVFLAALGYFPAILLCLRNRTAPPMQFLWLMWTASLVMDALELLSVAGPADLWHFIPAVFKVLSFVLCLLVVANASNLQATRLIRATDLFLAGSVCALCIVVFLLPSGIVPEPQWLAFLTLLRAIAATAAILAMRSSSSADEYGLMRFIALYQTMDLVSTFLLNQVMGTWLHQTEATYLDFLMELPGLGLALLMVLWPNASFRPAGRGRFMVRSTLPLFLSITILALSLWLLPKNHLAGIIGIAISILGYAFRSILSQGLILESEEQLRSSVAHLSSLADRDPLTNVGNRRAFDRILTHEWSLSTAQAPVALIFLDIDLFKEINDTMGHLYGDSCLRSVASVLERVGREHIATRQAADHPSEGGTQARTQAHICRFGGDEFAVVLPNTSSVQAIALADRILAETLALRLRTSGDGPLTISAGVAASSRADGRTVASLIAEADEGLLSAKRGGRGHSTPAKIALPDDELHNLILRVAALALRPPLPPR